MAGEPSLLEMRVSEWSWLLLLMLMLLLAGIRYALCRMRTTDRPIDKSC